VAVSITGNNPGATEVVPDNVAVPLAPAAKLMPAGNVPVSVIVAAGDPLLVTANVNGAPTTAVAELALVICGTVETFRVSVWLVTPTAFVAVNVTGNAWGASEVVPDSVAVPLPRSVNVMPVGSAPPRVIAGVGEPVVVTVKANGEPDTGVADVLLVNSGTVDTVKVNG